MKTRARIVTTRINGKFIPVTTKLVHDGIFTDKVAAVALSDVKKTETPEQREKRLRRRQFMDNLRREEYEKKIKAEREAAEAIASEREAEFVRAMQSAYN